MESKVEECELESRIDDQIEETEDRFEETEAKLKEMQGKNLIILMNMKNNLFLQES